MRTLLALAEGVVTSPFKRPHAAAGLPEARLTRGPVDIPRDRLARYGELCGFAPDPRLPLPYPHLLGFPLAMRIMSRRDFPLPLLGLVHTWITIERYAPLTSDDRPEITVYAESLAPHRRGTEVTMVTKARVAGERVWESRSGYLARHARPEPYPDTEAPVAAPLLPAVAEWQLPADLGRRYGAVSGDRNPIHLHPLTARAFGFPRAIAHGMWTFARCLAELDQDRDRDRGASAVTHVRAEFRAPVLLPAVVTYASAADGDAGGGVAGRASGRFQLRSGDRVHLIGETSARSA
ncbi:MULTISPECIES: MaoC family dehydratase [Streptomyces]|uniref:MaoC/PaaZ C-terminal domain-containing protein n=1 Tax=Streptomyces solicathayae TaxID=3081768 RepID=A0ABZ0LU18_9ACTN|nr:MaoC/PaaZ C-terminal domain-containing protein [Streptomyces sp. HUAS YS2]WOX22805.1 MaoC/PaaZ C-terminal domain-containing protein [Streptomyces sp. HUAS YS2]